jgi:hypothetical protein
MPIVAKGMKMKLLNGRVSGLQKSGRQIAVAAVVLALGVLFAPTQAAVTTLVPFDSVKNAASGTKIKFIIHYEFSKGGHSQTNTRNHLTRLANKYGFRLDRWTAQADVTPTNLAGVDIAVFNQGDGDVLEPANSSYVTAMKNFIEVQGKSILNVHAAAAYVPCPTSGQENLTDANCRWLARVMVRQYYHHDNDPTRARIYADSVRAGEIPPNATGTGAVPAAIDHGRRNVATKNIFNNLPPNGGTGATASYPYTWDGMGDEWYNWRGYPRQQGSAVYDSVTFGPVIILMSLDETGYTSTNTMGDRPESWVRAVGNGMSGYNNMGHSDAWTRARTGNGLGGTVNDSIVEKYNWRLLKFLGHDFAGCMNPAFAQYNPEASVTTLTPLDDAAPCKTPLAIRALTPGTSSEGIRVSKQGAVRISVLEAGSYQIRVTGANGASTFAKTVNGGSHKEFEIPALGAAGSYLVQVTAPSGKVSSARVIR